MATEEEDGQCCVMEEGTRCSKDATGQPWSFTKRLMRAAWGRHKLEHDEKIPSQRICDHHREMLVNLKRQLDSKRKKPTPAEEESVVSVRGPFPTLARHAMPGCRWLSRVPALVNRLFRRVHGNV